MRRTANAGPVTVMPASLLNARDINVCESGRDVVVIVPPMGSVLEPVMRRLINRLRARERAVKVVEAQDVGPRRSAA